MGSVEEVQDGWRHSDLSDTVSLAQRESTESTELVQNQLTIPLTWAHREPDMFSSIDSDRDGGHRTE